MDDKQFAALQKAIERSAGITNELQRLYREQVGRNMVPVGYDRRDCKEVAQIMLEATMEEG